MSRRGSADRPSLRGLMVCFAWCHAVELHAPIWWIAGASTCGFSAEWAQEKSGPGRGLLRRGHPGLDGRDLGDFRRRLPLDLRAPVLIMPACPL